MERKKALSSDVVAISPSKKKAAAPREAAACALGGALKRSC
jgi:hypothetical protein